MSFCRASYLLFALFVCFFACLLSFGSFVRFSSFFVLFCVFVAFRRGFLLLSFHILFFCSLFVSVCLNNNNVTTITHQFTRKGRTSEEYTHTRVFGGQHCEEMGFLLFFAFSSFVLLFGLREPGQRNGIHGQNILFHVFRHYPITQLCTSACKYTSECLFCFFCNVSECMCVCVCLFFGFKFSSASHKGLVSVCSCSIYVSIVCFFHSFWRNHLIIQLHKCYAHQYASPAHHCKFGLPRLAVSQKSISI